MKSLLQTRTRLVSLGLIVALLLAGCGRAIEPPAPVYLRIAGSTSMQRLLNALTTAYVAAHPQVTFDLQAGGSELGLDLLEMGQVEVAACSWPPTAEKLKPKNGAALKMTLVAQDGLAVVVHPSNPLDNLNILQLRGLFQGRILDWRELGGRLGDVLVISREDGSGSRAAFESLVMDRRPVTLAAIVMPSSQDAIDYVGSHPLAIGYVSMGDLTSRVKALTVEGVEPTPQTVKEGSYPLIRPLLLVSAAQPAPAVRDFLDFASGPTGQDLIKDRYGTIRQG